MTIRDYDDIVAVTVFCDDCGNEYSADYKVPAGTDSLTVAREYLQAHQNWETGDGNDYCPDCVRYRNVAEDDNTLHVMPVDDLVEHQPSDECVCHPSPDPVERKDGTYGWLYVHHSLDGREVEERRAEQERARWENFATVRRIQWCKCREDSHPHVWIPADHPLWPSGHDRVPPSLRWELSQFQDDARFAGIMPPTPHTVRSGQ